MIDSMDALHGNALEETATTRRPWVQSYGDIAPHIDPDAYGSIVELLEQAMVQYADKTAFRSFGQSLSFRDVDRLSARFASCLQRELGVRKGDRIAVMMPNLAAFPVVFLGIARLGAVQVNVNPLYTPRELAHQLADAGVKIIVVFNGSTPTLAEAVKESPVEHIIGVAPGDALPKPLPGPVPDARLGAVMPLSEILREDKPSGYQAPALTGDDLLFLQYTGGTTGLSKGACLSHRNLVANTEQYKAFMHSTIRPGDEVVVTALPLYHIFALMVNFISYFSVGAENWLVANPRDLDGLIDTFKQSRLTVFAGVNTLYAGLAAHPRLKEVDFTNLRLSAGGGAAVIEATAARWKEVTGCLILEGYGLSETSPVLSINPPSVGRFTHTTGLPVPSTDIKLVDDEGREVSLGQPGEICARGPQVMSGYWQQPEANAAAFTADGYFRTGDVGVLDEQGFLKIVDRIKDMIIVSGFNVYPNEIEAVATACPGVAECACVGAPDEKTGEALRLFVVKAPGATLSEQDVIDHCRASLTGYKVPRLVRIVEALPKSTVGKILRRELRDVA
ncbi:AMP-binding protein [Variovorax sp. J22R24]|uniref:AMP-binding protein n=1 Tax=Variovorax gracilis TaxID=3053502 RepID=UPI002575D530|nr:AMP-binding protein [Variovorax sp. J22R24]MDM0109787.1 AMP-binding protein [Variovorax sp. J22R24]